MQVAALGHLLQKRQQQPRLMPHRFQIFRGLLFRALRPGALCQCRYQQKTGQETTDSCPTQAAHHKKASNIGIVEKARGGRKYPAENQSPGAEK